MAGPQRGLVLSKNMLSMSCTVQFTYTLHEFVNEGQLPFKFVRVRSEGFRFDPLSVPLGFGDPLIDGQFCLEEIGVTIPSNKLCMGSTTVYLTRSKYFSRANSVQ